MIAWLNWTISSNELLEATASALRTGCQKVLDVENDPAQLDIRTADLDTIIYRFRNKHRGTMKDQTIDTYEQRFRQTVEMYSKWLNDDNSWRPATRKRSSSAAKKTDSKRTEAPKAQATTPEPMRVVEESSGPKLIQYPFPIRPGLQGMISLPEDLTTREAQRIANFVASLAFEDEAQPTSRAPLAITSGRIIND